MKRIEKGSIFIEGALTAIGLWLLKTTIGESVKEAWKQCEMHSSLVEYLTNSKEREEVIDRCVDRVFDAWNFEGFLIESIEKEKVGESGEDSKVRINLNTAPILKKHVKENVHEVNVEFLLQELEKEIIRLKAEDF